MTQLLCEVPNLLDIVEFRADDAGDGRTVEGRVVPYDTPTALYGDRVFEVFKRGALSKSVRERGQGIPLYLTHNPRSLIGRAVGWRDEDDGMHAEFRVSETPQGDEALTLVRDGALHSFSIGFIPVPSKTKIIDEADRKVTYERSEVKLDHVALVPNPAYRQAKVLALRDDLDGLDIDALAELALAYRDGRLKIAEPAPLVPRPSLDELRERLSAVSS